MKIQDYLHLYLGCKCKGKHGSMIYTLIDVGLERSSLLLDRFGLECVIFDFKLILRPLDSITFNESINISSTTENGITWYNPHSIVALCKMGFDMFGLIDTGMALDATKLTTTIK